MEGIDHGLGEFKENWGLGDKEAIEDYTACGGRAGCTIETSGDDHHRGTKWIMQGQCAYEDLHEGCILEDHTTK